MVCGNLRHTVPLMNLWIQLPCRESIVKHMPGLGSSGAKLQLPVRDSLAFYKPVQHHGFATCHSQCVQSRCRVCYACQKPVRIQRVRGVLLCLLLTLATIINDACKAISRHFTCFRLVVKFSLRSLQALWRESEIEVLYGLPCNY